MGQIITEQNIAVLSFPAFDTCNRISVPKRQEAVLTQCLLLSRRLHQLWSPGDPDSDVSRLGRGSGWVPVDPRTAALVRRAAEAAEGTGGYFDPTIGWATRAWRSQGPGQMPGGGEPRRPLSDWRALRFAEDAVFIPAEVVLDLGGIAKGAIADALIDLLRTSGVEHALLDLGGHIALVGGREDHAPWRIGLRYPCEDRGRYYAVFAGQDCSVVTSAGNERYLDVGGTRCCHLLDPASGRSAETDLVSATVIAPESVLADALSTACYVAGRTEALRILARYWCQGAEGALLDRRNRLWLTGGLSGLDCLVVTDPSVTIPNPQEEG